jgi:hypothetical protein
MFAVTRCRRRDYGRPAARGGAKQGMAFLVSLVFLGVLVVFLGLRARPALGSARLVFLFEDKGD